MLGEMVKLNGHVAVGGDVAYAAQQAWIFNDSVKNNILFGLDEEKKRYQQTVKVSSLISDLESFPVKKLLVSDRIFVLLIIVVCQAGDETEIGEKGFVNIFRYDIGAQSSILHIVSM
jgi:ABC-type multidrug transport system fused ATPase/permease subunit